MCKLKITDTQNEQNYPWDRKKAYSALSLFTIFIFIICIFLYSKIKQTHRPLPLIFLSHLSTTSRWVGWSRYLTNDVFIYWFCKPSSFYLQHFLLPSEMLMPLQTCVSCLAFNWRVWFVLVTCIMYNYFSLGETCSWYLISRHI